MVLMPSNVTMEFIKIAAGVSIGIFGAGFLLALIATYFGPLGILLFWSVFVGIGVAFIYTSNGL